MTSDVDQQTPEGRLARWMGVDLPPTRDYAMARIGSRHTLSTGRVFSLDNGDQLPMLPGEELPKPDGCDYWNDRYFFHVAKHLGDSIAAEVDAYRLPPPAYSTNANAWADVHAEIERRWLQQIYAWKLIGEVFGGEARLSGVLEWYRISTATPAQRLAAMMRVIEGEGKNV